MTRKKQLYLKWCEQSAECAIVTAHLKDKQGLLNVLHKPGLQYRPPVCHVLLEILQAPYLLHEQD